MRTHEVKYDDISIKVTGPDDLIRKADELFFNYLNNKTKNVEINKPKTEFDEKLTAEPVSDRHHLIDWKKYAEDIKNGKKVQVGDSAFTKLTNGEIVDFVITDITDDYVRFETRDLIDWPVVWNEINSTDGGYVYSDIRDDVDREIWKLLPEDLQAVVSITDRLCKTASGTIRHYTTKLFLPAASEIFDKGSCFGDNELYKQLDYYKNARNKNRADKYGYPKEYWLASVKSDSATDACYVNYDGSLCNGVVSDAFCIPVCFCISKN